MGSVHPSTPVEEILVKFPAEILYFNKARTLNLLGRRDEACSYYNKSYDVVKSAETLKMIKQLCGKGASL